MSRFENSVGIKDLYRIGELIFDNFVKSYSDEPPLIIVDCDDNNNNTYGQQELSLFCLIAGTSSANLDTVQLILE